MRALDRSPPGPSSTMDSEQILAFRLARSGLTARTARSLAEASACPASDFARDAALLALAARADGVSRGDYERPLGAGDVVVAHVVRAAIHALAPADHGLYGPALVARDDVELGVQLGRQVQRLAAEHGFSPTEALDEVAAATTDALRGGTALDKNALHEELRHRVGAPLMPWCRGCGSFHVASMLWRYATVSAGVRLDAQRRYVLGRPGRTPAAHEAVRRFLHFYGPATTAEFADWAGLAKPHAQRLWDALDGDLAEVRAGRRKAWLLREDLGDAESPPDATGVRLLPAGDPYLQKPNRALLAPDESLRKRLFRPVASPGAVLVDGRLQGVWRAKAKGRRLEVTIEPLAGLPRAALDEEAERVARVRDAGGVSLVIA